MRSNINNIAGEALGSDRSKRRAEKRQGHKNCYTKKFKTHKELAFSFLACKAGAVAFAVHCGYRPAKNAHPEKTKSIAEKISLSVMSLFGKNKNKKVKMLKY